MRIYASYDYVYVTPQRRYNMKSEVVSEPPFEVGDMALLPGFAKPVRRKKKQMVVADSQPAVEFKKAVEAIHVRVTAGKLTLMGRKLFNVLLFNAQDQGVTRDRYSIPLSMLVSEYEFEGTHMSYLKESLRKLNTTQVEWDVFSADGKKKSWATATMISGAKIEDGVLLYGFDQNIKEELLYPATYQRMNFRLISRFQSAHALALYENTMRFVNNTRGTTAALTTRAGWRIWAALLSGAPEDVGSLEYKYWKRDTLQKSIDEVNELSDIQIEPVFFKNGRAVSDIQFKVLPRQQTQMELDMRSPASSELVQRMVDLGCVRADATAALLSHSEQQIRAALDATVARMSKSKLEKLTAPGSYFLTMLRGGHALTTKAGGKDPEAGENLEKKSSADAVRKRLEEKFHAWRVREEEQKYKVLSDEEQRDLYVQFVGAQSENKTLATSIRKYGLETKSVQVAFFGWLALRQPFSDQDLLHFALSNGLV